MKRIMFLSVASMCMSMAFSCTPKESETFHRNIKVTNNAEYTVYVAWEWVEKGMQEPEYPLYGNIAENEDAHRVKPGETNTSAICVHGQNSFEGYLKVYGLKIFFVDPEIYDPVPIGSPVPNEALLDSRVFNLEDLKAINFHVQYPLE